MNEQISLFDKPKPLDIRGLLDDGYCPVCGHSFDEYGGELDLERCPVCNTRVDWSNWHILNDKIKPCPYKEQCFNHPAGCAGQTLWCGRDEEYFEKYGKKER